MTRIPNSMIKLNTSTQSITMVRYHVESKTTHLRHRSTDEQIVDIFIKVLEREKLKKFKKMLGLVNTLSDQGVMLETYSIMVEM